MAAEADCNSVVATPPQEHLRIEQSDSLAQNNQNPSGSAMTSDNLRMSPILPQRIGFEPSPALPVRVENHSTAHSQGPAAHSSKKPAATKTLPQRPAGQYPKGGGKGLKLGPNVQVNAGGSTTSYTVKKGDTLSGIAKTSGVKLSEILAANPTIADKKSKYKGGSMIWSGTKVKLPTKK